MNYKVEGALKKSKLTIIIFIILWFLLAIVFIMPLTGANYTKIKMGHFDSNKYIEVFAYMAAHPLDGFKKLAKVKQLGSYIKNLIGFTLFYSIILVIGIIRLMPKHRYDDMEHGSSDWSEHGEQYQVLSKKAGIILAENNYLPVDKRGNVNVLVVGGSGSGKSASYSIPNAFQMLGSYVFTDPKGELYDKTAGYLKKNGYEIKVLNLVNPVNSDGYNPLMHISGELDVDVIANTIVKGQTPEGGKSDPYWDDMAEILLKALIYYLIATRPEEEQNLASCSELVRAANSNGGSNLLTELINQLPYDHPARMNYKSIEIAPEKTYGSILSSLQSKLSKFDSKDIAEVTSTNTIDFEEIGNKKTAVYVISSDTHTAYDFLLTIFFSQMIQQLYDHADKNGGRLKVPTYFILDEFANIGQIPDFDKKISTSRSKAISFSVILQNLDQLEAIYEKSYETIMGNCDTHVFLGSNSYKTVEYFSKALGEKTITRDNLSINRDKDFKRQGYSDSDQIMARALMTPDELRRMDNDLCIIYEKGLKPIKARKYYYFETPMIKQLQQFTLNHLDVDVGDRGKWRKYNTYNPYNEDEEKGKEQNLKVESLDDLFEDDEKQEKVEAVVLEEKDTEQVKPMEDEDLFILPQDEEDEKEKESEEIIAVDIQKQLEAKFDELFGDLEDNNE